MKIAFVCWRPCEVFNAIRLILGNALPGDNDYYLYLINYSSLDNIKESLIQSGVFKDIYSYSFVDPVGNTIYNRIKILLSYIFRMYILKHYDRSKIKHSYTDYDIIMFSGWTIYSTNLANVNPKAKIFMFEDGTGSYFGDKFMRGTPSFTLKNIKGFMIYNILAMFHRGMLCVNVSRIYVNTPELILGYYPYEIMKMPNFTQDILDIAKTIFGYKKPAVYDNKKVVFLSENFKFSDSIDEYDDLKICSALEKIKALTVIRIHPAAPHFQLDGFSLDESHTSWELLVSDIDNYIIIGKFSSAMFTPYMLYPEKRFILIFLYRIMSSKYEHLDKLVNLFKKINPNLNIYVPNTFEEYNELVQEIMC